MMYSLEMVDMTDEAGDPLKCLEMDMMEMEMLRDIPKGWKQ